MVFLAYLVHIPIVPGGTKDLMFYGWGINPGHSHFRSVKTGLQLTVYGILQKVKTDRLMESKYMIVHCTGT